MIYVTDYDRLDFSSLMAENDDAMFIFIDVAMIVYAPSHEVEAAWGFHKSAYIG